MSGFIFSLSRVFPFMFSLSRVKFDGVPLLQFYEKYLPEDMTELKMHALKTATLFGSTYSCEQLFSPMKHIKSSSRSRLTDEHLESCLRVTISTIEPNIDRIIKGKTQIHSSH